MPCLPAVSSLPVLIKFQHRDRTIQRSGQNLLRWVLRIRNCTSNHSIYLCPTCASSRNGFYRVYVRVTKKSGVGDIPKKFKHSDVFGSIKRIIFVSNTYSQITFDIIIVHGPAIRIRVSSHYGLIKIPIFGDGKVFVKHTHNARTCSKRSIIIVFFS